MEGERENSLNSLPPQEREGAFAIASPVRAAQDTGGLAKKPRPGWDENEPMGPQGLPVGLRHRLPSHRGTPTVPFGRTRPPPRRVPGKYHLQGRCPDIRTPAAFPPN